MIEVVPPLVLLPTELFLEVLHHLPASGVLALKLTCRATYNNTKKPDGSEIVDVKEKIWGPGPPAPPSRFAYLANVKLYADYLDWALKARVERRSFGMIMAESEARHHHKKHFTQLTCAECGLKKHKGSDGFCDAHFKNTRRDRMCMGCLALLKRTPPSFKVSGTLSFRCKRCRVIMAIGNKHKGNVCKSCNDKLEARRLFKKTRVLRW